MHRNTYLLVTVLAVFAALVIGVNVGRGISGSPKPTPTPVTNKPTLVPTPEPAQYNSAYCGIAFEHPSFFTKLESTTGSAVLVNTQAEKDSIIVTCQAEIPRPPLPANKIETMVISSETTGATVAAKVYHDASPKDGTPIDLLIFLHPKTRMDVYIAGFGETFTQVLKTVKLLP